MTPGEKWVFYTFLFLFLALLLAAVMLYLPQHLQTVARRAYFYLVGDDSVIREVDVLEYSSFEMKGAGAAGGNAVDGVSSSLGQEATTYMQL